MKRRFNYNSPLHGTSQLGLFDLQLRQQIDKPLEAALISIDPKEIHFAQVHHRFGYLAGPLELAAWTTVSRLPVAMHYGLQNGGEGRDANAGANEHSVLGAKDVARGSAVGTINENLKKESVAERLECVSVFVWVCVCMFGPNLHDARIECDLATAVSCGAATTTTTCATSSCASICYGCGQRAQKCWTPQA